MSFQWLSMRITEEQERRQREAEVLTRLPRALQELHNDLKACVADYQKAFGPESVEISGHLSRIRITVREFREGKWEATSKIEIRTDTALPGFVAEGPGSPLTVEVGMLPGDKTFFRDTQQDQYINAEELTRRILDRGMFPKLPE